MNNQIKNIVITGGGTAGWMSAALLSRVLMKDYEVTLIESDDIGTIGVGEATIPPIQLFNNLLGLNEAEFLKQTKGTIKLGIQFENWGKLGDRYMHAFGNFGRDLGFTHFHHYWLRAKSLGLTDDFWDYSFNYQAARNNLFSKMDRIPDSPLQGLVYAYHFDAGLYAKYLREISEKSGVKRIEGKITSVNQHSETGFVESVVLESGSSVAGDLFIDCSGGRALLIEQTLQTGFEDYSDWLFCDRAVAIPCESVSPIVPYTRSIAHVFGWQWRIPLQHRIGNGMVYSSEHTSDEQALKTLLEHLDGEPLAEPNFIKFKIGRRKQQWNKNVVSIGLSSGFLEPLESTSIHLIQQGITRLVKHLPARTIEQREIDEYNLQSQYEFEKIRDFIILHYYANQRCDSDFWKRCQSMTIPDSLRHKIELFKRTGKLFREQDELFSEVAWHQVLMGQNIIPESYHPLAESISKEQLAEFMQNLKIIIKRGVGLLPTHQDFLRKLCQ